MNASDLQSCLDSLNVLTAAENGNKNYLFMVPVDTTYIPDYTSIIARPMDLGTIRKNLESNKYASPQSFWADVDLVFTNAQLYHKDRKETQHVVKFAKDMMKLVAKEKKKKTTTAPKQSLKLKLSAAGTGRKEEVQKPKATNKQKTPSISSTSAGGDKPKKLKLTLSINKNKASSPVPTPPPVQPPVPPPTATAPVVPSKPVPQKIRINTSVGPNRGKELPKGITPAASTTPKVVSTTSPATKKPATLKVTTKAVPKPKKQTAVVAKPKIDGKATKTKKTTPVPQAPSSGPSPANVMTLDRKIRCMKVLSGLRRRQQRNVIYFIQPVSDKTFIDDYKAKIPFPMDLGTMSQKLERDQYASLSEFALDLRRVFSNCLRFNTTKHDSFRPIAVQLLKTAEELMAWFMAKPEAPNQVYPSLLYCWELCVNLIDRLLNVTNQTNGHQTAHYFMHPASYYFGGSFPGDYLAKVSKPMDFGTVTSNLIEGRYQSIAAFTADCRLVIENCLTYYGSRPDGNEFTQQATHLKALMSQQLVALTRYDESPSAKTARLSAVSWQTVRLAKPPETLLLSILTELREVQYTDRLTKLSQPVMRPFEKPVDLSVYQDYLQYAPTPMDLETVEHKVRSGSYETPEDFEYDILLIFKNCEAYNAPRKTDQLLAMGKYAAKEFRKLFSKRMKAYENPETESKKRSASPLVAQPAVGGKSAKKLKVEPDKPPRSATPRISINAASAAEAAKATVAKSKLAKSPPNTTSIIKKKEGEPTQPVPLHVAISEVKSRYPLRRPLKLLEPWEVACAKFYKDLMKHPWISVARPKFIYHVPVPIIFPELKASYEAKIKNPMDLTTAESKLFQGGLYYSAQDFVDDLALVFANAIAFNKSGRDEGDHLSIAYYDASIYLLKYTRWLSLEHFQSYLTDDPHTDDPMPDGMPPSNWKLSHANRKKAHEEMENTVINEYIDKGLEGDRFPDTWMESEIEKLLKALRHQSDLKHMSFFLSELSFPADYTAFISKPMAWERVQKNLKKRRYNKFGEVIDDLRLIFSNALKYNERHKDIDETSAKAYDGAVIMSGKLESAIEKMFLAVSDRLGREKVENAMQEREEEAAERAESERVRQAIANGDVPAGSATQQVGGAKTETVETVRIQQRRPVARRDMDMELPFFDEDDASNEQSHVEAMRQQRATFERQQQERKALSKLSLSTGALLLGRHVQSEHAKKWVDRMFKVVQPKEVPPDKEELQDKTVVSKLGSSVAAALNKADRPQIKLQTKVISNKRKYSAPAPFSLE
jgi:Bromodomain